MPMKFCKCVKFKVTDWNPCFFFCMFNWKKQLTLIYLFIYDFKKSSVCFGVIFGALYQIKWEKKTFIF